MKNFYQKIFFKFQGHDHKNGKRISSYNKELQNTDGLVSYP